MSNEASLILQHLLGHPVKVSASMMDLGRQAVKAVQTGASRAHYLADNFIDKHPMKALALGTAGAGGLSYAAGNSPVAQAATGVLSANPIKAISGAVDALRPAAAPSLVGQGLGWAGDKLNQGVGWAESNPMTAGALGLGAAGTLAWLLSRNKSDDTDD